MYPPPRAVLGLVGGIALLNLALSFHNLWPTLGVRPVDELSLDLCVGLALLALHQGFTQRPLGKPLLALIVVLLLALIMGRYVQVSAPALLGRELNLYWDLRYLPAVAAMATAAQPPWVSVTILAALGAGLVLLTLLLAALVRALSGALAQRLGFRRLTLALCTLALCVYAAGRLSPRLATEHWFALSVAGMYAEQLGFALRARTGLNLAALAPAPTAVAAALDGRRGSDVELIFLESFGAVARDNKAFAAALRPDYAALEQAAAGWHAASAWLRSVTFGGSSWLAHASVLSGSPIDSEEAYQLLLAGRRETLVQRFKAAGYRTVALMPGLKNPWPEGRFYGFDRIYASADIDYPGPSFSWWAIPDQYSLDWLMRRELHVPRPQRPPLLVFFPTVMSHAPFKPVPPYLNDRTPLGTATPYSLAGYRQALALAARRSDAQAYLAALRYDLAVLAGHLSRRAGCATLIVALGDHQPPAYISGATASWDVPVHVFSPNEAQLRPFIAAGFQRGVRPADPDRSVAEPGPDITVLYRLLLLAAAASASDDGYF